MKANDLRKKYLKFFESKKHKIINESYLCMLLSEESLAEAWGNPYDERWDDVL